MSTPLSPEPVMQTQLNDLPAYLSNGLIGIRVLDIPLLPGVALVNGFATRHPVERVEAAARTPYPLGGDITIDGVSLRRAPQAAEFTDQRYDFATGELITRFRYGVGGVMAHVTVLTLCSRTEPTLALQETTVEVDGACDLVLRAMIDPANVQGRMVERHLGRPDTADRGADGSLGWEASGEDSRCGIAYATEFQGGSGAIRTREESDHVAVATDYRVKARAGNRYRLRHIASMVPDVLHAHPDRAAYRLVARAADVGFEALREANRRAWQELWLGRVLIDADDDRWQRLADAAFFYLNASVHPSSPASTSIFGLAQWDDYHYYRGHVMWDIETFSLPPLLLSQPDAARSLLDFRTRTMESARSNAMLMGRRGLQFPWEAGPLTGHEAAPEAGTASWYEDHVSPDIALAFAQYAHATGDRRFLVDDAGPVLFGVSDWIVSRVTATPRGYEILRTMGIAERQKAADNDAYTTMIMRRTLEEAITCAELLGRPVPEAWRSVHQGLDVRRSATTGAVLSHDGYHASEEKGATPGPLAGLFPAWYQMTPQATRATLDHYLGIAADYVGEPMLSPLYYVWAAWAGDRRLSARMLEAGYGDLVGGRFLQTLEMAPSRAEGKPRSGPFFANLGGFLMGLLYGLPGLRVGPGPTDAWAQRPVVLPAGWRSVEVDRVWVRGEPASLQARQGQDRAVLRVGSGNSAGARRSDVASKRPDPTTATSEHAA